VIGTTGILRAIARSAPTVRRVVVTSSFAAIVDNAHINDPNHIFSEASWNPVTLEEVEKAPQKAYRASKKLAERAAWDFVQDPAGGKGKFELVTINPPMVYGPVPKFLHSLDAINTSNERFVDCLRGKWRDEIADIGPVFLWVDVRDVAEAHVKAGLELPEAAGKRLFCTAGTYSNAEIAGIIRKHFPEDAERLPTDATPGGELPPADKRFKWDNSATNALLGINWASLEQSVVDTVKSLKKLGA
jgi:nucleoside-diphosphate-sugar epimerase